MRREDIAPKQAEAIKQKIRPMLAYLNRLKRRMDQRKFPHDDTLFNEVVDSADAMHKLNVSIHYLSCGKTGGHAAQPSDCFADAEPLLSTEPHDQRQQSRLK
jgi:hypothetical protein